MQTQIETQDLNEKFETNIELLKYHILLDKGKSKELEEVVDTVQTIFFLIGVHQRKKTEIGLLQYMETPEYMDNIKLIDSYKLNLIKQISNL
jgi:hypothetical protein